MPSPVSNALLELTDTVAYYNRVTGFFEVNWAPYATTTLS